MKVRELKKEETIEEIRQLFKKYPFVLFYNFSGLTNESLFSLKKEIKSKTNGAKWKVYKNSLISLSFSWKKKLKNNNALVFSSDENDQHLTVLKTCFSNNEETDRFNGGYFYGNFVEGSELKEWAKLPSRKVLISSCCFIFSSFLYRLVKLLEKISN